MTQSLKAFKWLPQIDPDLCNGCGKCVLACGPACLKVTDGLVYLTDGNICGSEEHCIGACPEEAIVMKWLLCEGDHSYGTWLGAEGAASK